MFPLIHGEEMDALCEAAAQHLVAHIECVLKSEELHGRCVLLVRFQHHGDALRDGHCRDLRDALQAAGILKNQGSQVALKNKRRGSKIRATLIKI